MTLPAVPAPAIMVCVAGAADVEGWEALFDPSTSIELCCSDIFEIKSFKASTDSGDLKFQNKQTALFLAILSLKNK